MQPTWPGWTNSVRFARPCVLFYQGQEWKYNDMFITLRVVGGQIIQFLTAQLAFLWVVLCRVSQSSLEGLRLGCPSGPVIDNAFLHTFPSLPNFLIPLPRFPGITSHNNTLACIFVTEFASRKKQTKDKFQFKNYIAWDPEGDWGIQFRIKDLELLFYYRLNISQRGVDWDQAPHCKKSISEWDSKVWTPCHLRKC